MDLVSLLSYSIESLVKNKANIHAVLAQSFQVNVINTDAIDIDDVVLAYVIPSQVLLDDVTSPIKQLFGFQRVHLNVGETKQVFSPFNMESILIIVQDGPKWFHLGQYQILIGNQRMFTMELHGYSSL